ncbi:DNA-binding response regulator [Leptolyngbya sp. FACHB-16]|uniref:response regulator transcription factor n=1 Tax=unclassified Leptolyngbya TaxID=2650499 RepID=UPI001685DD1A|nr:DNA-binding response regulator [Leptolyngbya sp. FACHB-16]MBD2153042.1 DNA-binding response regulator [Leptolyngbya sp. FACHB-16]
MSKHASKRILVIEEHTPVRNAFINGLLSQGFEPLGAENGRVGIQYAQSYLPDLITSGIALQETDGFTVLRTLRDDPRTAIIPLIFVTANMNRSDLHKAMELGANGYLTKPCSIEELVRTITAQLEQQSLRHQSYAAQSLSSQSSSNLQQSVGMASLLSQAIESYDPPLDEVFRFIKTNYHRAIALNDVAQAVGYSPAYLTNLMGRQTGQTIQQWIIQHRMAAACALLLETDQAVEQIASQVGYHHTVHFFRQFRRLHGTTPQAWRNDRR